MKNRGFRSWASKKGTKFNFVFYYVKRTPKIPEDDKVAFAIYTTDRILNGAYPVGLQRFMPEGFDMFQLNNNQSAWNALLNDPRALTKFYKTVKPSTLDKYGKMVTDHILGRITNEAYPD